MAGALGCDPGLRHGGRETGAAKLLHPAGAALHSGRALPGGGDASALDLVAARQPATVPLRLEQPGLPAWDPPPNRWPCVVSRDWRVARARSRIDPTIGSRPALASAFALERAPRPCPPVTLTWNWRRSEKDSSAEQGRRRARGRTEGPSRGPNSGAMPRSRPADSQVGRRHWRIQPIVTPLPDEPAPRTARGLVRRRAKL